LYRLTWKIFKPCNRISDITKEARAALCRARYLALNC